MEAIETLQREAAAQPGLICLAGGLPSPTRFPRRGLRDAFARSLHQPTCDALQYGWPEGSPEIRKHIALAMARRGATVSADSVIVTSGAQQALSIAATLLKAGGDTVWTDPETYPGALTAFRTHGLRPTATRESSPAFAYVMPSVGNPSGLPASDALLRELLDAHLPILEDDAYADLRFDGAPRPSLLAKYPERVWHVGTFSKTLAPGMRVGWLIVPPEHYEAALALKRDDDMQANGLCQSIVAHYLDQGTFGAHLAKIQRFYARRARSLARAVRKHLPGWKVSQPEGGFALWVAPPGRASSEVALLRAAMAEGVSFDPGSMFRPDQADAPLAMRLCFSLVDERLFDEGVARLSRAWRQSASM